ncbi:M24 family metallopeptidase [Naumannella huperziae]
MNLYTFSDAEYSARMAAVRRRMADAGLDVLLISDPANLFYLIGYDAWSFYTPQLLYVPLDGDTIFYARAMDAHGATRTSWLPADQVVGYPEGYVHRDAEHPFDWVGERLAADIAPGSRIGLELDTHFFSPKAYLALRAALPGRELVDSAELVNWVRVIKSDTEIDVLRRAAQITTAAMTAAIEAIDVGVPQHRVAAAISAAQIGGTDEVWGDYPAIVPMLPTSEAADTPHLTWTDRRFVADDAVAIELAGAHRRYHVPLARTIVLGRPSDRMRQTEEAVAEGLAAVLDTMAAGVPVRDVSEAWNAVLRRRGLAKESRLGYSIGIAYPPDWGERTVSIRPSDDTVLAHNMTFHVICGMWMKGYGYEASESVRVTDDGVECFTDFPRGLLTKE